MSLRGAIALVIAGALAFPFTAQILHAQDAQTVSKIVTFYVDKKTGQVFINPGRGRVPMVVGTAIDQTAIEQHVEAKTREQVRAAVAQTQAQQQANNADLQKQIAEIKPAWKSYTDNFQNKLRFGALAYLDWGLYTHAGFGPQFLENLNPPGVGNSGYNSFDINRVYLNTYFTPTENWTFRFTPEIYRANGASSASSNSNNGKITGVGSNLNGDMNVRMKYAFVQYKGLLDTVASQLKGANLTFGAQPNPFLPWEEDFGQYRFVYLAPWNYISLSSSQVGLQMDGPVKLGGGESTYLDYGFGVYNNGSFKTAEQSNTKQVMVKGTIYPFGANWRYQGLGMTGFWDYGWGNVTPDSEGLTTPLKGSRAQFERIAALLHYATPEWNIAGEFDYGKNAFNVGNLYSGSGPQDAFGTATGAAIPQANSAYTGAFGNKSQCGKGETACYNVYGTYGPQVAVYNALLNNGRAKQEGFDIFGHFHIPTTKFTLFGMFQWFMPNVTVRGTDPLDFQRFVAGVSYQYNEYLRFALDSQNLLYYHNQLSMPIQSAETYNYVPGETNGKVNSAGTLNGRLLPTRSTPTTPFAYNGKIPFLVPRDIHSLFFNMEFSY